MRFSGPRIQRIEVERGVHLAVEVPAESDKPVLILCNSIGSSLGMWDEVVERLSQHARIFRYDTRGHGGSAVPPCPYTIDRLGRDVIAILDSQKVERAAFCGLSLGGLSGMWLGIHATERLSGLVLANTAPSFPPPSLWQERAAAVRSDGMAPLVGPSIDRWFTKTFQGRAAQRVAEIGQMVATTPAEGYAACCEVLATTDLTSQISKIACPVRVIAGRFNSSTPPSRGDEIVARIAHADMVVLEAAHISAVEVEEVFSEAVQEFISRIG